MQENPTMIAFMPLQLSNVVVVAHCHSTGSSLWQMKFGAETGKVQHFGQQTVIMDTFINVCIIVGEVKLHHLLPSTRIQTHLKDLALLPCGEKAKQTAPGLETLLGSHGLWKTEVASSTIVCCLCC